MAANVEMRPMPRPVRRRGTESNGIAETVKRLGCECWCKVKHGDDEGILAVTDQYILVCRAGGEVVRWVHKNDVKGVELTRQGTLCITPTDASDDPSPLTLDTRPFSHGEGDPALRIYQEIIHANKPPKRAKPPSYPINSWERPTETKEVQTQQSQREILQIIESSPVRVPLANLPPVLKVVEQTLHNPIGTDMQTSMETTLREEFTTLRTDIHAKMMQLYAEHHDKPKDKRSPDTHVLPTSTGISPSSGPWYEDVHPTPDTGADSKPKYATPNLWDWVQDSEASPFLLNANWPPAPEKRRMRSRSKTVSKSQSPNAFIEAPRQPKVRGAYLCKAPSDMAPMGPFQVGVKPRSQSAGATRKSPSQECTTGPVGEAPARSESSDDSKPPSIKKESSKCSTTSDEQKSSSESVRPSRSKAPSEEKAPCEEQGLRAVSVKGEQPASPWDDLRGASAEVGKEACGAQKSTRRSSSAVRKSPSPVVSDREPSTINKVSSSSGGSKGSLTSSGLWEKVKGGLRPSKGPWEEGEPSMWEKVKGGMKPSKGPWEEKRGMAKEPKSNGSSGLWDWIKEGASGASEPRCATPWAVSSPATDYSAYTDDDTPPLPAPPPSDAWPYHKPRDKPKKPPPRKIPTPSNPSWPYATPTPFPSVSSMCP